MARTKNTNGNGFEREHELTDLSAVTEKLVAEGKVPPHSLELEMNLLGGLMIDNTPLDNVMSILKPKHFYKQAHQKIFQAIIDLSLRHEPIDLVTITEELKNREELETVGGAYYLSTLTNTFTSSETVEYSGRKILEYWLKRDLISLTSNLQTMCFDSTIETKELLNIAQRDILDITNALMKKPYTILSKEVNITMEYVEGLHERKVDVIGVPSGYTELDKLTGGFQNSELIIVAGRPSMGKTALALSIARNAAVEHGKPIGIFSIEMSNRELALRFICAESKVDISKLKTGRLPESDWAKISHNVGKLTNAKTKILIDDSSPLSLLELRAKARRMKREHDVAMIIIDYLQLMEVVHARAMDRHLEVAYITRGLKELAKELDIPVMALSQLSRKVEDRSTKEKRPMLSDLRESGSIEQDADVVIFVNRPEVYIKRDDPHFIEIEGLAEVIIGKQRNGPIGDVKLTFINTYARFENRERTNEPTYYTPHDQPF